MLLCRLPPSGSDGGATRPDRASAESNAKSPWRKNPGRGLWVPEGGCVGEVGVG